MADHPYLVRVDPDLWKTVKAKAKTERLSLKALWERLLRRYLADVRDGTLSPRHTRDAIYPQKEPTKNWHDDPLF